MKQNITLKQLDQLSENGKEKLRKWCFKTYPKGFLSIPTDSDCTNPLLSIGQMIEFLGVTKIGGLHINTWLDREWSVTRNEFDPLESLPTKTMRKELCNALFSAIKEVLEHE